MISSLSQLASDGLTMTDEGDLRSFLNKVFVVPNSPISLSPQQQQQQSNSSLSDSSRQHFTVIIPPHRFRSFSLPSGLCWRNNNIVIGEQDNSNNSNHSRRQSAVYNQQVINLREFRETTSSNMSYPNPNLPSPQPHPACPSIGSSLPYTEALKAHQKSRLNFLLEEMTKLQEYLSELKNEVDNLEKSQQTEQPINDGINWPEKVLKLREENRHLRIECHCLSMEVDLYASGELPLGHEGDADFYRHLNGGTNGPFIPAQRGIDSHPRLRLANPNPNPYVQYPPSPYRYNSYNNNNPNILNQVPPAPRHVWVSPPQGTSPGHHSPLVPPRPSSASPRLQQSSLHFPSTSNFNNGSNQEEGQKWVCKKCTFENHAALASCEMCETQRNTYLGTDDYTYLITNTHTQDCYCNDCFNRS